MADAATQVLETWRNRLIDLTFRNPLLELKPRSLITIANPDGVELWQALRDGRSFRFPLWERRRAESTQVDSTSDDTEPRATSVMVPGDIAVESETASVGRLLKRLQDADRALLEEQGVASLYLAVGVLKWHDVQGATEHRSPLLLLPVSLERATPLEPFRLVARDDDPAVNPALRERLRSDYHLDLPGSDDEEIDPAAYLTAVKHAVRRHKWSVEPHAYVGRFHFAKLVMYREMMERLPDYAAHPLLNALATGSAVRDAVDGTTVEADALDTLPVDDVHEVLDADSTQLIAIRKALTGSHLVIEGPPGTGKSQTITNIIASLLGEGKHVLFVSEKAAALEVVASRLQKAGLGEFILPIYGKPDRGAIVRDLDHALSTRPALPVVDEQFLSPYLQTRTRLHTYVQALHTPVEGTGWSPYAVYARLSRLEEAPRIDFPVPDPVAWTEERRRQLSDILDGLATYSSVVEAGPDHPWFGYAGGDTELLAAREERADDLLGLLTAMQELNAAAAAVATRVALAPPSTVQDVAGLATLLRFCDNAPVTGGQWFEPTAIAELSARAREWAAKTATYRELATRLNPLYPPETRLSGSRLTALKDVVADLDNLRTLHPDLDTNLAPAYTQFVHSERLLASRDTLNTLQPFLVEELGLPWPTLVADIPRLHRLLEGLLATPAAEPAWLAGEGLRRAMEAVHGAEPHLTSLGRARERLDALAPLWRQTAADDVAARLAPFRSPVRRLLSRSRVAAMVDDLSRILGAQQNWNRVHEVVGLMRRVDAETAWLREADGPLRATLGRYYNG